MTEQDPITIIIPELDPPKPDPGGVHITWFSGLLIALELASIVTTFFLNKPWILIPSRASVG